MLRPPVAEALDAGLDRAQPVGFVGMWLEGVADDVRAVQLHAGQVRRLPELGAVAGMFERLRHARHDGRGKVGEGMVGGAHDWI
jgi:hypothetical protein